VKSFSWEEVGFEWIFLFCLIFSILVSVHDILVFIILNPLRCPSADLLAAVAHVSIAMRLLSSYALLKMVVIVLNAV
jgi:hypothetical protein